MVRETAIGSLALRLSQVAGPNPFLTEEVTFPSQLLIENPQRRERIMNGRGKSGGHSHELYAKPSMVFHNSIEPSMN